MNPTDEVAVAHALVSNFEFPAKGNFDWPCIGFLTRNWSVSC